MFFNTIEKIPVVILDWGVAVFDIMFLIPVIWFTYRGIKKGFSSIYWLIGNFIGMMILVKAFKPLALDKLSVFVKDKVDVDSIPITPELLNQVIDVTVGIVIAVIGLILINVLLVVIYQFVKSKFKETNDKMPTVDSKVVGGLSGLLLGLFVGASLTTLVYTPVWGSYYTMIDNSISVKITGEFQQGFYNTQKTVSTETINGLIDSIKLITSGSTEHGSIDGILDILDKIDKDPVLGDSINGIIDGAIDQDIVPEMGGDVVIDIDDAYNKIVDDIFGEGSTKTHQEKLDELNNIFGWIGEDALTPDSVKSIPGLSGDTSKDLACALLSNGDVKPSACI